MTETQRLQMELDEMTAELLDRYEELNLLYDLGSEFASVFEIERISEIAAAKASQAIGATKALVAVAGQEGLRVTASIGASELTPGGLSEHVAATGRELLLHEDEPAPEGARRGAGEDGPLLAVPLLPPGEGGEPLGVLALAGKPGDARFTAGDAKLAAAVASQLSAAVYTSRLVESQRAAEAVRREIELASGIQRALLPEHPPAVPGTALAAAYVPAATVGGDYYDFLVDDAGRLSLVIADVAGHSIGSALMMAMARSILRREITVGEHPAAVLAATNAALFDDLVRSGLFITVFCARLDPRTRVLEYANGGHNPPFLHRAGGAVTEELDVDGAPLGILAELEFQRGSVQLGAADVILLYTDGVTEAAAAGGEQFGEERLRALVEASSAGNLVEDVLSAVRVHAGGVPQSDDVTLVTLRVEDAP